MLKSIVCAGLGGQGVLTIGKLLMYAAYDKGLHVTWFPSYGNEMRGGNANCNVIISDEKITTPYADNPDIVIAMSESAVEIFEPKMASGGSLYVNSSMINKSEYREDIKVVEIPATDLAQKLKNERNANLCILGKMLAIEDFLTVDEFNSSMCNYFEQGGKGKYNEMNVKAIDTGYNF